MKWIIIGVLTGIVLVVSWAVSYLIIKIIRLWRSKP